MKNQVLVNITDVNNIVNVRGVYPEAPGATLGTRGGALSPWTAGGYKNVPVIESAGGQIAISVKSLLGRMQ